MTEEDTKLANSAKKMFLMLGGLGLALPIILVFGNWLAFGKAEILPSISTYYYSGMSHWFVSIIFAMGIFLMSFEGYEDNRYKVLSIFAGIFAIVFAMVPTTPPEALERGIEGYIHSISAGLFYLSLALLSIFAFSDTEGLSENKQKRRNWVYKGMGVLMIVVVILVLITDTGLVQSPIESSTFWLEYFANIFFGAAWLVKGDAIPWLNPDDAKIDNWEKAGLIILGGLVLSNAFLIGFALI